MRAREATLEQLKVTEVKKEKEDTEHTGGAEVDQEPAAGDQTAQEWGKGQ